MRTGLAIWMDMGGIIQGVIIGMRMGKGIRIGVVLRLEIGTGLG